MYKFWMAGCITLGTTILINGDGAFWRKTNKRQVRLTTKLGMGTHANGSAVNQWKRMPIVPSLGSFVQ